MEVTIVTDEERELRQDRRTEYSALSSYFKTVVNFRFQTVAFYLAAVSLILSKWNSAWSTRREAFVLMVVTMSAYMIELRNRTLYNNLADRAIQIEHDVWGYVGETTYYPFFTRMMRPKPPCPAPAGVVRPKPDYPKILGIEVPFQIRHSDGIDLLYLGMLGYAVHSSGLLSDMLHFLCSP